MGDIADILEDPAVKPEQKLNVVGMIGLIVFYLIIFFAGILSHKYATFVVVVLKLIVCMYVACESSNRS